MQRKPIANKYRKGTMKSTLHSTHAAHLVFGPFAFCLQAPKGVKERVKSPYSETILMLYNTHLLLCEAYRIHNILIIQRNTIGQSVFASF